MYLFYPLMYQNIRPRQNSTIIFQIILVFSLSTIISCKQKTNPSLENPQLIPYSLQNTFPHDTKSFTEGLEIHNGELFESTGQEGSWLGIVDIKTGLPDKKVILDNQYFGEGMTVLGNKVYQLTWRSKTGFVYDLRTFNQLKSFSYETEGWGLTHTDHQLIMSDGSDQLQVLDTSNLTVVKRIKVTYNNQPLTQLNELEYVNGFVYANIWQTNLIAKIDFNTGVVAGFLDLTPLVNQARLVYPQVDVLNGIAWHEATQSFLVTGKYWPYIYVLKLKTKPEEPA